MKSHPLSEPTRLSVQLLGLPRIHLCGRPLDIVRMPKVLAMLAYLLIESRPHSRDALADLFWPNSPARQAQQNLRQVLYRLRKLFDQADDAAGKHSCVVTVVTDRQTVSLDAGTDVWVDVSALEGLMERVHTHNHRRAAACVDCVRDLEEAIGLYRGPLLEGLGDVGSASFEQWLLLRQESLHYQVAQARYILAEHHLAHGRAGQARIYLRQLLDADPWNEAAERLFLQVTWQLDGRNAALDAYWRFADVLASELGVLPEDETKALVERIESAEAGAVSFPGLLSLPVTPFFGREQEQMQLAAYLAQKEQRLITLLGVGGCGKTRLALEVAHAQRPDWRDGVWFIPLAQVSTAERLTEAIVEALIPTLSDTRATLDRLLDFVRHRELLLVLDNFEHLVPDGVGVLRKILQQAPLVKLLITSQARLNIPEEWTISLDGLDFPAPGREMPASDIARYSAVKLFVHHARRVNPAWSPTSEDWTPILHICQQVGGLPLGIELVAAWGHSLSTGQMVAQGQANLAFFQAQVGVESPPRHNLREVFARAYTLLPEEARRLFVQLAVFQGGFDLTAAEKVAAATLSLLATLLNRSMLQVTTAGRWEWHPLLHRFATELLDARPEKARAARQRHATYYLDFLQAREERLWGAQIAQVLAEIEGEIENVQAAWDWAVSQRDTQALERGLEPFSLYHYLRGFFERGEKTFGEAARQLGAPEPEKANGALVARLMAEHAYFLKMQARYEAAVKQAQKAATLAASVQDRYAEARALMMWGTALQRQGDYPAARVPLDRALALTRDLPDRTSRAVSSLRADIHRALAAVLWKECRYSGALSELRQAETLDRQMGSLWGIGWTHNSLGLVLENMGHCDQAIIHYGKALEIFAHIRDRWGQSIALGNLGYIYWRVGKYAEAREHYLRDLQICREIGDRRGQSWTMDNLSLLSSAEETYDDAYQYARQALQIAQEIQERSLEAHIWTQMGRALEGLGRLGEAAEAYRQAYASHRELDRLPLAMEALAGLARVLLAQGDVASARDQVEEVLACLETDALDRTDDQMGVYLSCYRVLHASQDPRAGPFLERTCKLLKERAERIGDQALRTVFLHVTSHQALLAAGDSSGITA